MKDFGRAQCLIRKYGNMSLLELRANAMIDALPKKGSNWTPGVQKAELGRIYDDRGSLIIRCIENQLGKYEFLCITDETEEKI